MMGTTKMRGCDGDGDDVDAGSILRQGAATVRIEHCRVVEAGPDSVGIIRRWAAIREEWL